MIRYLYECNIKKNTRCNKRNCSKEYCQYTTNFKYAKHTIKNVTSY